MAPNGDLYAAWSTQVSDGSGGHSAAVYSKSTDGGATWSTPALIFPALDAQNLLNRQHWQNPTANQGGLNPTSGNFGKVTAVTQNFMRFFTFGVRVNF